MARMALVRYAVRGSGQFPLDMLRHDCCWPSTYDDVMAMDVDPQDRSAIRTVNLVSIMEPTAGRWSSFMWHVQKEIRHG